MPLVLLIETDGGPDHNPTFLRNILSLFGLFLVGNMDKLLATRCCSGLSYLNVAERGMSLLNIGLSALSLQIDPEADDFLLEDVLAGCNSMETSRLSIKAYDDAVRIAIRIIERRMGKEATSGSNSNDDVVDASSGNSDESNANNATKYKVGDEILTFWPGHGTFQGRIILINKDNEEGKCIRVKYEDDDEGDFTEAEIDEMVKQSKIPIGAVGFRFVRKFRGGAVFNGTVISVKSDDKIICRYDDPNDNKKYTHTITQLEKYSMYKLTAEEDDDSERESESESDESEVEEVVANNNDGVDNDGSAVIVPTVVAKQDKEAPYRNKHVRKLSVVPAGMNTEEYVNMLKQRRTAHESFLAATGYAKEKVESRFRKLKLDGRDVQTMDYATDADRSIITDALKKFDDTYDETYSSKSKQKLMPQINNFLSCPKHCRMTPYTVEFRLCGEEGCALCTRVGRRVRTPDMCVEGVNVRKELLRFMTLPILNPEDKKHYLPPDEARRHIRENKLTADDLRKMIPDSKRSKRDKDWEARRGKDKKRKWDATKLRAVLTCTRCGGPRCVFSMNAIGNTNGPTEEDLHKLNQSIEAANGYVCGDNIAKGRKFYSRRAMRCGMPIESQYYNPKTGTKGGRIVVSDDVCAICYVEVEDGNDLVASDELRTKFNLGGKTPLPICRGCFDDGVEPPCSGGRKNVRQAEMQKKQQKKRQRKDAEERGRRKSRKES